MVDSTGALGLKEVPKRMLILGGGIIGLEMGTAYSTLGARSLPEGIEVTFAEAEEGAWPLHRKSTIWCCRPWAARPAARRSPPKRLV